MGEGVEGRWGREWRGEEWRGGRVREPMMAEQGTEGWRGRWGGIGLLEVSAIDVGIVHRLYGFRGIVLLVVRHIRTHTGTLDKTHVKIHVTIHVQVTPLSWCVCVPLVPPPPRPLSLSAPHLCSAVDGVVVDDHLVDAAILAKVLVPPQYLWVSQPW